ncbi:MAG: Trk system potassium transporter TrkA [Anaerovoracaceae bacterium]
MNTYLHLKGIDMNIAVVGAGKLGKKITKALLNGNHSITILDTNEDTLQKLSLQMDVMTYTANGKQISVLKEIHISSFDFLIAVTGNDETNMTIAAFAKKLGCSRVIARVRDPEHMNQFDFIRDTMSIDYLINPDMAITNEIYKYLVEKYTLSNGVFTTGKASLIEFKAKNLPAIINLPMTEIKKVLDNKLVVAISRHGKVIIPHGEDYIKPDDALYVIGEKSPILQLNEKVHEKGVYTGLQNVMIIGGGKTGLYLANKLAESGLAVKIIEQDLARCHYLAEKLENVMILRGDGTDISLLEEENLGKMDAFVTCTGYDEDNLLLALMAKDYGINDVIAKVSRGIYTELVSNLGVDMALNPLDIITSNVLRIVQGSKKIVSSQLIQGQAVITEVIVSGKSSFLKAPLKKLELPKGLIVAAIHRQTEIIIPNGDTVIEEFDRVLLFSLLSALPEIEKFTR